MGRELMEFDDERDESDGGPGLPATARPQSPAATRAAENLARIADAALDLVNGGIVLTDQSESPKMYEHMPDVIRAAVEANQAVIAAEAEARGPDENRESIGRGASINIDKAVFVGTAADLQRQTGRPATDMTRTDADKIAAGS